VLHRKVLISQAPFARCLEEEAALGARIPAYRLAQSLAMVVHKKTYSVRIILCPDAVPGPNRSSIRPAALTNPGQVLVPTSPPCLPLSSERNSHRTLCNTTSLCSLSPCWFLALGLPPDVCLRLTSPHSCRAEFPALSPDTHSLFLGLNSGLSWCREVMTGFFHPRSE